MTRPSTQTLEEAIRHAGDGWLIDFFGPPREAMNDLGRLLAEVHRRGQERLGGNAPNLTESALVAEYNRSPLKVKGFFQILSGTRTPDMLLMAWRIIQGMEIKDIQLSYSLRESFRVRVILESPYGEPDAPYESQEIQDFTIFRHFGIMEISGRPVFDGFYALKVR